MVAANHSKKAEAVVQSVEFHPTSNVILTAGFHKTLDLFQVKGLPLLSGEEEEEEEEEMDCYKLNT